MEKDTLGPETKLLTVHSLAELIHDRRFSPRNHMVFEDEGNIKWSGYTDFDGTKTQLELTSDLEEQKYGSNRLVTTVSLGNYTSDYHAKFILTELPYQMSINLDGLTIRLPRGKFLSPKTYSIYKNSLAELYFNKKRRMLISPTTIGDISREGSKAWFSEHDWWESDAPSFNNEKNLDGVLGFLASLYQRVEKSIISSRNQVS